MVSSHCIYKSHVNWKKIYYYQMTLMTYVPNMDDNCKFKKIFFEQLGIVMDGNTLKRDLQFIDISGLT